MWAVAPWQRGNEEDGCQTERPDTARSVDRAVSLSRFLRQKYNSLFNCVTRAWKKFKCDLTRRLSALFLAACAGKDNTWVTTYEGESHAAVQRRFTRLVAIGRKWFLYKRSMHNRWFTYEIEGEQDCVPTMSSHAPAAELSRGRHQSSCGIVDPFVSVQ